MLTSHKIIFFLNSFCIGLTAPVLTLIFLAHGAAIETLPAAIGLFSAIVVLAELPSGMMADLIGRKNTWLLSICCLCLNHLILIFSGRLFTLMAACFLMGLGRAFGSGSIEALEVEQCTQHNEVDAVMKINSTMALLESSGLSIGAVTAGFLGCLDDDYTLLLMILIGLELLLGILSLVFIHENHKNTENALFKPKQIKQEISGLLGTISIKSVRMILAMSMILGISLAVIETYWQPTLLENLPNNLKGILGIISCLGYLCLGIGNKTGEYLNIKLSHTNKSLSHKPHLSLKPYWLCRFLLPVLVISLGLCSRWYIFIFLYGAIYMLLGIGNLFENTLLHLSIDDRHRAGMLSLSSLCLRGGGMIESIIAYLLLTKGDIRFVWAILPMIAIFASFFVFFMTYHSSSKHIL